MKLRDSIHLFFVDNVSRRNGGFVDSGGWKEAEEGEIPGGLWEQRADFERDV